MSNLTFQFTILTGIISWACQFLLTKDVWNEVNSLDYYSDSSEQVVM